MLWVHMIKCAGNSICKWRNKPTMPSAKKPYLSHAYTQTRLTLFTIFYNL